MGKKNYIAALLATVMISGCSYMPKKEYVKDVLKETVKVTIDSIVDNSPTIKSDEMYMDTHSHIKNLDYYQNGIEDIIETSMDKVDILVMMVHGIGGPHEINYEEFKQKTKEHTKYKVKDYGKYFEITTKYDRLLVIKAQEIGTKEKKDVLAIGSDKIIKPEQDLEKAIEDIHHNNGIAIIAHPMSVIKNNFLRFGIANKEDKETLEPACYQADAMEEFNSLNQFWMYPSNVSAKHFVEEKGLVGTAGSDSHGNLNTIGLAGIIIKKDYIDINNLIENLREVIRNKDFKTHKEYASPKTFYDNLIGPKIKKKGFSGFFKKR